MINLKAYLPKNKNKDTDLVQAYVSRDVKRRANLARQKQGITWDELTEGLLMAFADEYSMEYESPAGKPMPGSKIKVRG